MPDRGSSYNTVELSEFTGLNTSVDSTKKGVVESDSPFQKNFVSLDGLLASRQGRIRVNSTRYVNEITSLVSYQDRSNVSHYVFSVKTTVAAPTPPDGTLQQEVL
jgi:hypothetical protein